MDDNLFFKTSLIGKVNNLPPFKNEALLPVFEAVANSIQAIEEKGNVEDGKIVVKINRDLQQNLKGFDDDQNKIIGFDITDNGIGFDNVNYDSFLTAETTHKITKGCKGIGRFFWLKSFERVEVHSVFYAEEQNNLRQFDFSLNHGINSLSVKPTEKPIETIVKLIGFKESYRKQPSAYKTTSKIAQRILEHCFSYFINKKSPIVIVQDEEESICLNDEFIEIKKNILSENIQINEHIFKISHIKLYSTHNKMHNLVFCANSRGVKNINISNLLGTSAHFDESDKKFVYSAYISSEYFDKNVDSSRVEFNIPEKNVDLFGSDCSISMDQIKSAVLIKSKEFLADFLVTVLLRKKEIASEYVSTKNPTLKSVLKYCPEIYDEIEPTTSEEKLDEILYKHKGKAEYQIRKNSKKLLKTQVNSIEEIKDEYKKINAKIESFQKDQLAGYILFRKMIIDLLDKKLSLNSDGKYNNEDIVHDIIFPRKSTTDEIDYNDHNMWLIDERLTFHAFATSDNRLCDTTTSDSEERPDIITFSEIDKNDRTARAVSIIELKKPQRKNFDEDPTRQLYRYVRKIRDNKVRNENGRDLIVTDTTRFYCYAICDLTNFIKEYAENNNYAKLKGEFGYYSYNRILNAHTEIIAYDKIIIDVTQRHKMFFEKLGI